MIDELEWKTRRDRINTKLKALNPAWNIVKYEEDYGVKEDYGVRSQQSTSWNLRIRSR